MILTKGRSSLGLLIVALACLFLGAGGFALGYRQGQRSLRAQLETLADQEAISQYTPGRTWSMANAMPPPMAFTPSASLPANASPEMREFLENRAKLMSAMQEWREKQGNGAHDPSAFADFRREHEDLFQRQQQLSQIIGQQQVRNPLPRPPPLRIPPNASPQLQIYLTARDQLMRDQIAYVNQHRNDDPQTRMVAWRQQNAARFAQMQQVARAMAQTSQAGAMSPVRPAQATNSVNPANVVNPSISANSTRTN